MHRWFVSLALFTVSAIIGVTWIALGRSAYAAPMTVTLLLNRLSFQYKHDVDGQPFLEGIASDSCRVIDFERIRSEAERVLEGTRMEQGRPTRWSPLVTSLPLVILPIADAAPAEFWNVRLNQLVLNPGTRVTASAEPDAGINLTLSEQRSGASLTFDTAVEMECQQCRIGDSGKPRDVLWLRLESSRERTVAIDGHRDTFTLNLQGIDDVNLERGLALANPVFYHVEPTRRVSYLLSRATILLPDLRVRQIEIPAHSVLDLTADTKGDSSIQLSSFVVTPSGLQVTLEGPVTGISVDDREFLFTQRERLSELSVILLAAIFGTSLISGSALALIHTRSRVQRQSTGTTETAPAIAGQLATGPEVFLSYASNDRSIAEQIARAFAANGLSVWWDREIPHGAVFDEEIEKALLHAGCVVVLWSKDSVKSRWVRSEASSGAARDALVPVLIGNARIPVEFDRLQTADLTDCQDPAVDSRFAPIVTAVRRVLKNSEAAGRSADVTVSAVPEEPS